jgi:hypothetical protein
MKRNETKRNATFVCDKLVVSSCNGHGVERYRRLRHIVRAPIHGILKTYVFKYYIFQHDVDINSHTVHIWKLPVLGSYLVNTASQLLILSNGCRDLSPGVKLTIHMHLVPRLRMYGAKPQLSQYDFMAWCFIKRCIRIYCAILNQIARISRV